MLRRHRSGNASDETAHKLGLSIGEALWEPGEDPPGIEALLRFADREMYREEEAKKKRFRDGPERVKKCSRGVANVV